MGNRYTGSEVTVFNSWEIKDVVGRRHEFVTLAAAEAVSMVE
jgi:hypothetical protein